MAFLSKHPRLLKNNLPNLSRITNISMVLRTMGLILPFTLEIIRSVLSTLLEFFTQVFMQFKMEMQLPTTGKQLMLSLFVVEHLIFYFPLKNRRMILLMAPLKQSHPIHLSNPVSNIVTPILLFKLVRVH